MPTRQEGAQPMRLSPIRPLLAVLALASVAGLLAACGGSSDGSTGAVADLPPEPAAVADGSTSAADAPASETTGSSDPQQSIIDFTQCLRDQGLEVDDPDFSGGGAAFGGNQAIDLSDPDVRDAFDACRSKLQGIGQQFSEEDRQAFQEAALQMAQCLRDKGLDVEDPDFSGDGPGAGGAGGPGGGPFGGLDMEDEGVRAAVDACQEVLQDVLPQGGPAGGPAGGPSAGGNAGGNG